MIKKGVQVLLFVVISLILLPKNIRANEVEVVEMNLTAYCTGTVTASGTEVKEGVAAVSKENMGKIAIVYTIKDGQINELLGIFDCLDTGGAGVKKGYTIDIYRNNLERCQDLMDKVYENGAKGRVLVKFVDAVG